MNRHVSSTHAEIPWLSVSLNTSHSPLTDFISPWYCNCSCHSVTALGIVDVVIRSLLRCQTMDMFRHLYRSGTFAYSMLNTTVSIARRLFTHIFVLCMWITVRGIKLLRGSETFLRTLFVAQFVKKFPPLVMVHCCPCAAVWMFLHAALYWSVVLICTTYLKLHS